MLNTQSFSSINAFASRTIMNACVSNSRVRTFARRKTHVVAYKEDEKVSSKVQEVGKNAQQGLKNLQNNAKQGFQEMKNGVDVPSGPDGLKQSFQDLQKIRPEQDSAVKLPLFVPGFTRRREVWVGRWAMVGFFAALLGEIYTQGLGPVAQVEFWTGLSPAVVRSLLGAILVFSALGAVSPATYSKENQRDVAKRLPEEGKPQATIDQGFGFKGFGFLKANELFTGRMAMLGFLAAVIGEGYLNTGPAGQVAHYFGAAPDYIFVKQGLAVSTLAAVVIAYLNGNYGQVKGDEDLY